MKKKLKKLTFSCHEEIEDHIKLLMKSYEPSKLKVQIESYIKHLDKVVIANGDYV
jgi:hypothetical protein